MQSALSIRYGGLLVDANECDYTSFKHLGLICPNCKKSVFVVAESGREAHSRKLKDGRTTAVKECKVPQHFAHHPDVSLSQVEACELRVKKMTQVQRAAIQVKARNQRLKILHAHFWKILNTSCLMKDYEERISLVRDAWIKASVRQPNASQRMYQLLIEAFTKDNQKYLATEDKDSSAFKKTCEYAFFGIFCGQNHPESKAWQGFELENMMHLAIVKECAEFLCQKSQFHIFSMLTEIAFFNAVITRMQYEEEKHIEKLSIDWSNRDWLLGKRLRSVQEIEDYFDLLMSVDIYDRNLWLERLVSTTRKFIGITAEGIEPLGHFLIGEIVALIASVDWAGEFERLHNQELEQATVKAG